jgi:hypothetical protein
MLTLIWFTGQSILIPIPVIWWTFEFSSAASYVKTQFLDDPVKAVEQLLHDFI